MYKTAAIFLLLCAITTTVSSQEARKSHCPPPKHKQADDTPDKKLHQKCLYPTVKVTDADGTSGGTGFIVRSTKVGDRWHNVVLGAQHTIHEGSMWVHVTTYKNWSEIAGSTKYPMFIYAANEKIDMAVGFFASDKEMPTADLDFAPKLYMDTKVFHIGSALLDDARIDHGEVTQPKTVKPEVFKGSIRTNVYTFMGDSGGPLFLNSNYKVIGICRGIRSHHRYGYLPQVSYYRPLSEFKTWDEGLNNALESVYTPKAPLPVLPFVKLKVAEYDIPE